MSEYEEHEIDEVVARRRARKTMTKAGEQYADAWEGTAGSIVTGYVAIFEMTNASGRYCVWLTGTGGDPDEEQTEGLDTWRVEGLVRQVLRDINRENVSHE